MKRIPSFVGLTLTLCVVAATYAPPAAADIQDLSIQLQANKTTVEPEESYVYTVTVDNNGGDLVDDAEILLALDSNIDVQTVSNGGRRQGTTVKWEELPLEGGARMTLNVVVKVKNDTPDEEEIKTSAIVGGSTDDNTIRVINDDEDNNDDDRSISVSTSLSVATAEPEELVTATITLRNNGRKQVNNVTVETELTEGLEFLAASNDGDESGGVITWEELSIDGNDTRTISASLRIDPDARSGDVYKLITIAEGSASEEQIRVQSNNNGRERILINAFVEPEEPLPGENLLYTVTLTNAEPEDQRIDMTAFFNPDLATFVSGSNDPFRLERHIIEWNDLIIPQNERLMLQLELQVQDDAAAGSVIETAFETGLSKRLLAARVQAVPVSSSSAESSSSNQSSNSSDNSSRAGATTSQQNSSASTASSGPIRISAGIQANKAEVQPGDQVRYSINVQNDSQQSASNLRVAVRFSDTELSGLTANNAQISRNEVYWTIPTLGAGQRWTNEFSATATATVRHGSSIPVTLRVSGGVFSNIVVTEQTNHTGVLERLPATGISQFALPKTDQSAFVRQFRNSHAAAGSSGSHWLLWTIIITFLAGSITAAYRWAVSPNT